MKPHALLGLSALTMAAAMTAGVLAGPTPLEVKEDAQQYALQKPHLRTGVRQAEVIAAIAAQLGPPAAKLYGAPFSYYMTDEQEPDAYSYYGPRVYVSQGMVDFADSREELAGVMCHESSHVLHHDGTRSDQSSAAYDKRITVYVHRAGRITHHHLAGAITKFFGAGETLAVMHYSRGEEEAADLSGATLCSEAGSNPWGIVWMLQKLQKMAPSRGLSWLSDHPSNKARIKALTRYLKRNGMFASWLSDPKLGSTPLHTSP